MAATRSRCILHTHLLALDPIRARAHAFVFVFTLDFLALNVGASGRPLREVRLSRSVEGPSTCDAAGAAMKRAQLMGQEGSGTEGMGDVPRTMRPSKSNPNGSSRRGTVRGHSRVPVWGQG